MRRVVALLILGVALLIGACGDETPAAYAAAQTVALAPTAGLDLSVRDGGPHWLLRDQSGWCGAHEADFGGDEPGRPVATVRAAVFRDAGTAARAFHRLSPAYLGRALELRVIGTPWPVTYSETLPGEQSAVWDYQVRLASEAGRDVRLYGQFTGVQAGRVVLLVESAGMPPEQLVPAVAASVTAAASLAPAGC